LTINLSFVTNCFYINVNKETMKFRVKITKKNSGKVTYRPQVKKNFFEPWKGLNLNTGCSSIYANKYCSEVCSSEADAILFINMYKLQEFNNKETVVYKKIDN
jgi:hypothetical protein